MDVTTLIETDQEALYDIRDHLRVMLKSDIFTEEHCAWWLRSQYANRFLLDAEGWLELAQSCMADTQEIIGSEERDGIEQEMVGDDERLTHFIESYGTTCTYKPLDVEEPDGQHHWVVDLEDAIRIAVLVVRDFNTSGEKPTAELVFKALLSEANGWENCKDVYEWASWYGFDWEDEEGLAVLEKRYDWLGQQTRELKIWLGWDAYQWLMWGGQ